MTVSAYYTKLKGLWDELETYITIPICDHYKEYLEQKENDRMM